GVCRQFVPAARWLPAAEPTCEGSPGAGADFSRSLPAGSLVPVKLRARASPLVQRRLLGSGRGREQGHSTTMTTNLSSAAWRSVFIWTLVAVTVSTPISVLAADGILSAMSGGLGGAGFVAAVVVPVLVGGP